ncbi:hypothetical protein DZB84_16285 [Bacillus sp. HNG]|uniref:hypothetical protein n=1 Tax=Bacillus sp. HNG TaxID=2293325 RepID=UPI000E2F21AF|nr:hypothetical protein [Bacillus sp. HNG]RFB13530.1 hypothetical protein DZB84_16285 [Bacillus sp. HNG]
MAFLFWPFMIGSLILSIFAIRLKKPSLLVISSILILPMALYLAATPRFEIWGLIFPLFYVGAAVSLAKRIKWLSILLIAPNFILIGWIGFSVMNQ